MRHLLAIHRLPDYLSAAAATRIDPQRGSDLFQSRLDQVLGELTVSSEEVGRPEQGLTPRRDEVAELLLEVRGHALSFLRSL